MATGKYVFVLCVSIALACLAYFTLSTTESNADQARTAPPSERVLRPATAASGQAVPADVAASASKAPASATPTVRTSQSFARPVGPLRVLIPELKRRALAGDSGAAYFLASELLECKRGNPNIEEPTPDGLDTLVSQDKRDCSGVDPADIAAYPKWLQIAADNGSVKAKMEYVNVIDNVMTPQDMIRSPELLLEYKNRAFSYMKGMAEEGNINAIGQLESMYANGVLAPQNYYLAYAYHVAVIRFNKSNNPLDQRILDEYASHLTPIEVQKAQDLGASISKNAKIFN